MNMLLILVKQEYWAPSDTSRGMYPAARVSLTSKLLDSLRCQRKWHFQRRTTYHSLQDQLLHELDPRTLVLLEILLFLELPP
jgi:hypothetical protein